MPKSKVRKKNDFAVSSVSRTPVKVKVGPSSVWFVALFIGLMLIGLVWLMVFQLAATGPGRAVDADLDGQPRPVELRRRVCFHAQRFVAHNAVAVDIDGTVMNSFPVCGVTGLATSDLLDHTRVIHPHCA